MILRTYRQEIMFEHSSFFMLFVVIVRIKCVLSRLLIEKKHMVFFIYLPKRKYQVMTTYVDMIFTQREVFFLLT
jgi:hypothetical protein